jgi:hypothetical protein
MGGLIAGTLSRFGISKPLSWMGASYWFSYQKAPAAAPQENRVVGKENNI